MELTQCINYLLTTAQHKVFQEMSSRLEKFDVTPVQYGVMYCLWIEGKTKPKEIAAELKLENSTISGVLERMETVSYTHLDVYTRQSQDRHSMEKIWPTL